MAIVSWPATDSVTSFHPIYIDLGNRALHEGCPHLPLCADAHVCIVFLYNDARPGTVGTILLLYSMWSSFCFVRSNHFYAFVPPIR